jgi:Ohr subfamily peroxiredoxin
MITSEMYKISATSVGGREGTVKTADGVIDLKLAMPTSMGGPGGAANPESLFASGYAACFNGAMNLGARLNHIRITGETKVTVTISLGKDDAGNMGLAAEIEARIPGVTQEVAQRVIEIGHEICPYSRATRGNIDVKLTAIAE